MRLSSKVNTASLAPTQRRKSLDFITGLQVDNLLIPTPDLLGRKIKALHQLPYEFGQIHILGTDFQMVIGFAGENSQTPGQKRTRQICSGTAFLRTILLEDDSAVRAQS